MKAYILRDYLGGEAYELNHAVVLRNTLQEAAQALNAEIMVPYGNGALVRILKYHIADLNIPSLVYRLQTRECVDESFVHHLGLFEAFLVP